MLAKQCPLLLLYNLRGVCDYPDLLRKFPARMQEECAYGGECLLRKVPLFGADNDDELGINIVQATELNREFAHQGDSVPPPRIDMGVSWYIRRFAVS